MKVLGSNWLMPIVQRRVIAALPGLIVALVAFWPHTAMATTLGDMFCSVTLNLMPSAAHKSVLDHGVIGLLNSLAYISGAVMVGSGLLMLQKGADNPRETPLHHIIARIGGGTFLLALPATIGWIFSTLALQQQGNGVSIPNACSGALANSDGRLVKFPNAGLDDLMKNLVTSIADPITVFLSVLSVIIGVVLVFKGLVKASKYGMDPKTHSVSNILANLFIGAVMITIGTSLDLVFKTMFGVSGMMSSSAFWSGFSHGIFATNSGLSDADLHSFEDVVGAALRFFQIIGFIAFVRGWLILKTAAEGGGGNENNLAKGLTHIFGGAMAINIFQMLNVLDLTFGTGLFS